MHEAFVGALAGALLAAAALQGLDARTALDAARRALAAGDRAAAYEHGVAALAADPRSADAHAIVLASAADDPQARALWSHETAAALCGADGKLELGRELSAALARDESGAAQIAGARAAAAGELAALARASRKAAAKDLEAVHVALWASELGRELVHSSPALAAETADAFAPGAVLSTAAQRATLEALKRRCSGASRDGLAFASILRGLSAQAVFEDLEGPQPPDLADERKAAEEALSRARAELAREQGEPWTVERLEELDAEGREGFTREHAAVSLPGVAISTSRRYRIETTCGFETLLGAAATVEHHHARLAKWYGVDPFEGRPGLLWIVPEAAGLESEGAPFWWAGGFQSGDVTTVRLSCGSIAGLGRIVTHELTHRFDGAVYPGIPAWLAEGRAVWTAAAYGDIAEQDFVAMHASLGTIDGARFLGYGARENLEKLIRGTIDDYRDNYVAGYALYVFLATSGPGGAPPRYADALPRYMKSLRGDKREPLESFTAAFCDGAQGRPADFEAFAAEFGTWVGGFYWRDRKPWTKRYVEEVGASSGGEYVLDEPTWVWSRRRAEPWFGQDQARDAGFALRGAGDAAGALAALTWSLAVDERSDAVDAALRELCAARGERDGAWVFARALERRAAPFASQFVLEAPSGPAPMLARLPKLRALLAAYAEASGKAAARGWTAAAAVLAADHDRLARLAGTPALAPAAMAADLAAIALHPFDEPERSLLAAEWVEDGLTDHERHRVPNLWCLDERPQLFVGRSKPRTSASEADRSAALHHAFVRTAARQEPGRYRIRARIAPTSSFVDLAIVVGYVRRDRNVRVRLSAGDYAYSIGDKDEPAELDHVAWGLDGLFERDPGLTGSARGGDHGFSRTVSAFEVEIDVDGGALHLFLEGEHVATYHTPDGLEIEGHVGFAVSSGEYKVTRATVQRLDRSAAYAPLERVPPPLDLSRPRAAGFRELLNRSVLGLPRQPRGTLCLWLAEPELEEDGSLDVEAALERARTRIEELERLVARAGLAQPIAVALPAALGPDAPQKLSVPPDDGSPSQPITFLLQGLPDAAKADTERQRLGVTDHRQSWLLFIDSANVLRAAEAFHASKKISETFERWLDVFRNR